MKSLMERRKLLRDYVCSFVLESVGFTMDGNVCYYVSELHELKSWDDARQFCRSKQADLIVIDSHEKKVWVW